jgi:alkylated DNA repair protein (DNA oxidative demethylase)
MNAAGLFYDADFASAGDRAALAGWLASLQPIWENRWSDARAADAGGQRRLLRPVYWLGGWQFACLDYYRPPAGVRDRCVAAEPYPPLLAALVDEIERRARKRYRGVDLPREWRLNTCLVNLYGERVEDGKRIDCARLGEHRDFEPGPVASLSLGERALFQFVRRGARHEPTRVIAQEWLADGSLQLFGGEAWKKRALHRVLRVEKKAGFRFEVKVPDFETRRVNFTFRWVPDAHIVPFAQLAPGARRDVRGYVEQLASSSGFWAGQLA